MQIEETQMDNVPPMVTTELEEIVDLTIAPRTNQEPSIDAGMSNLEIDKVIIILTKNWESITKFNWIEENQNSLNKQRKIEDTENLQRK